MSYSRILLIVGCITVLQAPSLSAQTAIAIGGPTKELKRTAHQLRISTDHLRSARDALTQATDLARRSPDISTYSQIAQNWIRLDRSRASAALEDLYGWVRVEAQEAPDAGVYQRDAAAAQTLLRSLATLDPARALALWQRWPDPPSSSDDAYRISQAEANARFGQQLSAQGSGPGGGQTPDLTQLRAEASRGVYTSVAALATLLTQSGEKAEALQLVDRAIANFSQQEPNPAAISRYMTFLRQLPYIDPDRFLMGLTSVLPAIDKVGAANAGGTVTVGTQAVQLTGSEAAVIDMCRSLNGRPELAMRTLNSVPGLKSKLDRIGGIDGIVSPSGRSQTQVSMSYSIDGRSRTTYNTSGAGSSSSMSIINSARGTDPTSAPDLYESVRGKLAKDPAFVRGKLEEAAKNPEQIDALIQLANRSNYQEPDLASLALEVAARLLALVEPLQKRAAVLQNLMRASQNCDGEVDAGLLQQGLDLVQQLRAEETGTGQTNPAFRNAAPGRMGGAADQLEMTIVAQLALENFDGALRYVGLMPDELKVQALLRIVQSLVQNY